MEALKFILDCETKYLDSERTDSEKVVDFYSLLQPDSEAQDWFAALQDDQLPTDFEWIRKNFILSFVAFETQEAQSQERAKLKWKLTDDLEDFVQRVRDYVLLTWALVVNAEVLTSPSLQDIVESGTQAILEKELPPGLL